MANKEQFKKRVIAFTIGGVTLLAILISVLVFLTISVICEKNKIKNYETQIAQYEKVIQSESENVEARKQRWWIEQQAREIGYTYPGDKKIG